MRIKISLLCALCLLALLPASCSTGAASDMPPEDLSRTEQPPEPDGLPGGEGAFSDTASDVLDDVPIISDAVPDVLAPDGLEKYPDPQFPLYNFGTALEESEPVEDDSFFDDAVFLGDSRTEGFQLWGGIHTGDYFWHRGFSVFEIDSPLYTFEVDGETVTMLGALSKKQYSKVYIMIGVNEVWASAEEYERGLSAFLDKLIALQPDAVIYLQTLPPINDELASKYLTVYDTNANVTAFNEVIVRMAAEKQVVLLDTAEIYRDEDGQLPTEMTGDGCHFNSAYYAMWADYLRSHTMDPERYFYCRDMGAGAEEAAP